MAPDDSLARLALAHFHLGRGFPILQALGGHGGFSGARLWRCESGRGPLCLRAWPPGVSEKQVEWIHRLMESARADQERPCVPEVVWTREGKSWVALGERVWEVVSWQPGKADFHTHPTRERLEDACLALAGIHLSWETREAADGPCPAVLRRLQTAQRWQALLDSGWLPAFGTGTLALPARQAWELVRSWVPQVPGVLRLWDGIRPDGWCLCDVWHDHLLFTNTWLTGLVDYGEVKLDHVAVDLARMLGSLVGDDDERWAQGLKTYRTVRPLSELEEVLARTLDRTGVILGATNWLRWLYHDGRQFDDLNAVARRLTELVERMERWQGGLLS